MPQQFWQFAASGRFRGYELRHWAWRLTLNACIDFKGPVAVARSVDAAEN